MRLITCRLPIQPNVLAIRSSPNQSPGAPIVSISRRILLGKLGLIVPAAAIISATGLSATAARAATEDAPAAAPAAAPKHHSKKKHHASKSRKHKKQPSTTG